MSASLALWTALAAIASPLFTPSAARAELPAPRFDRLTPLGADAGSEVEAQILGADIEGVESLLFDHPGIRAEFVSEKKFRIAVGADVPAGSYDVYLVGRFGVSNPRLFGVSRGLQDVVEANDNRTPEKAQTIEVNSAVNGTINGAAEDYFRFAARKGQRIVIDCLAQRLDSDLDGTLALFASSGQSLATSGDYYGADPCIDFVAPADGEYVVALHDLSYRGGYPYRLIVSDLPHVENIFPAAVQAGAAAALTVFGQNLGPQSQPSEFADDGAPLEQLAFSTRVPDDIFDRRAYTFKFHPTHHSVLPTAATCTLAGFQSLPAELQNAWNPQPLLATPFEVQREQQPNDTREQAQAVTLPAVVAGRFEQPRDADWFRFQAPESGSYQFEVYSERIAGRADPYLVLTDENGARIQELDDFGIRMNAFDGHLRDPSGAVNLTKDKTYHVLVQDRYQRGGARYQYVLTIARQEPDFYPAVIHSSNPNPGGTTLWKGSAAYLDVIVHAKGYNGPIAITAEDLPPGVHCEPLHIHNNTRGVLVLRADKDAAEWTGLVRLTARGEVPQADGEVRPLIRDVRPYSRVWNNVGASRPQRRLALAVREAGPFSLAFEPREITVEAGKPVELKLRLQRNWPDFTDKVTVQPLAFPGQFQMGNFDISAGQSEAPVRIQVQANAAPGVYSLTVQGQGQAPFNRDPAAAQKPKTLVSIPASPVVITVVKPSP